MGVIIFNGVSSADLGIHVEKAPNYEIPARRYNKTQVAGRSGDVMKDTGAYDNVQREYSINVGAEGANMASLASAITLLLYNSHGYKRLEDDYEPDVYMLASYLNEVSVENILDQAGRVTIQFDRKPQKYLKQGETPIVISSGSKTVQNNWIGEAKPLIKVYGSGAGKVFIQDGLDSDSNKVLHTFTLSNIPQYILLDCDIEDAYKYDDSNNLNPLVTLTNGWPSIKYKRNVKIWFEGSITKVEYIPRWWRL